MKSKSACVYILEDAEHVFYIGSTLDLKKRLRAHKNGHTKTTARMVDIKFFFSRISIFRFGPGYRKKDKKPKKKRLY